MLPRDHEKWHSSPTLVTPVKPSAAGPAGLVHELPIGAFGRTVKLSVPWQNLLEDEYIINAPRIRIDDRSVPALGGIPLLAKLGQGGMGAVYYGIHRGFSREVAVKILPFHLAQIRPDLVRRFFREAHVAAQVNSEHLVRVTDVAQEGRISYLVMEFVCGKSAGAMMETRRSFNERAALRICLAACKGLAAAHAANVVHRDVKPDNILVPHRPGTELEYDFDGCKLADLGLARIDDQNHSMTEAESYLGTPGFMAPEQVADSRKGGKPADVFGLGATLYAMLSGSAPFAAETRMGTMMATIRAPYAPIRSKCDVSKLTADLIDNCLAKDPTHRYPDGTSLQRALEATLLSLTDPHGVDLTQVNHPQIERETEAQKKMADTLSHVSHPRSGLSKRAVVAVAALCAVLSSLSVYIVDRYLQPIAPKDALIDPRKLNDSEPTLDAQLAAEERARKAAMEEFTRKQSAMNRKVIAEFDTLLDQISKAKAAGDAPAVARLLEKARNHSGYAQKISPRAGELDQLKKAD